MKIKDTKNKNRIWNIEFSGGHYTLQEFMNGKAVSTINRFPLDFIADITRTDKKIIKFALQNNHICDIIDTTTI